MKFLTRTTIVLTVLSLVMGSFVLAQNAPGENVPESSAEPVARVRVPVPTSSEPLPAEPPETMPSESAPGAPTSPAPPSAVSRPPELEPPMPSPGMPAQSPYPRRRKRLSQISSRKVLVIPATDVKVEDLAAITQDLQIMSHIFDERFKEPQEIKGVFVDFGDFFGRDSRETEAIYMQGYGALFLMEVNFSFSPPSKAQEEEAKKTEDVDPTWQRARQKIFSPQDFDGGNFVPEEKYSADKIEQLKTELIRTLKHAANIRNLKPDEWVILTVIGQGRQPGEFYEDYYRSAAPRSRTSTSRRSRRPSSRSSSSVEGAGGSGGGGGYGYSVSGSSAGYGGIYSRGSVGGGYVGMEYGGGMEYGEMGPPSATILTIRVKKSDVDTFAAGELDFEQFQQMVEIFTY
jgi:hypothetical protein